MAPIRPFIYIVFGAVVAAQVFLILILSVLARDANLTYVQNRSCVRPIMQIVH